MSSTAARASCAGFDPPAHLRRRASWSALLAVRSRRLGLDRADLRRADRARLDRRRFQRQESAAPDRRRGRRSARARRRPGQGRRHSHSPRRNRDPRQSGDRHQGPHRALCAQGAARRRARRRRYGGGAEGARRTISTTRTCSEALAQRTQAVRSAAHGAARPEGSAPASASSNCASRSAGSTAQQDAKAKEMALIEQELARRARSVGARTWSSSTG